MSIQVWSWVLTAVGMTGFVLAGKKIWWCWYINLACQVLWCIYAVTTEQYGFIVSSLAYSWIFSKNLRMWKKEHDHPEATQEELLPHLSVTEVREYLRAKKEEIQSPSGDLDIIKETPMARMSRDTEDLETLKDMVESLLWEDPMDYGVCYMCGGFQVESVMAEGKVIKYHYLHKEDCAWINVMNKFGRAHPEHQTYKEKV